MYQNKTHKHEKPWLNPEKLSPGSGADCYDPELDCVIKLPHDNFWEEYPGLKRNKKYVLDFRLANRNDFLKPFLSLKCM